MPKLITTKLLILLILKPILVISESKVVPEIIIFPVVEDTSPRSLFAYKNELYWLENEGELWKTDGVNTVTQVLDETNAITGFSPYPIYPYPDGDMIVYKDEIYYERVTEATGGQLWKTDGTVEGTSLVKTLFVPGEFESAGVHDFRILNDQLQFETSYSLSSNPSQWVSSQWVSDGTEFGTQTFFDGSVVVISQLDNKLVFTTGWGDNNRKLWISDGTADGTNLIYEFQNAYDWWSPDHYSITLMNNEVYFIFDRADEIAELWKTDGTVEGTMKIAINIRRATASLTPPPSDFVTHNNILYFAVLDDAKGWELWKTDGSPEGTTMLKDINTSEEKGSSYPDNFFVYKDVVYFTATDGVNGRDLWMTEGTAESTQVHTAFLSSRPAELDRYGISRDTQVLNTNNDRALFWLDDGDTTQIWKLTDKSQPAELVFTGDGNDYVGDYHQIDQNHAFFTKQNITFDQSPIPLPILGPKEFWFMDGETDSFHLIDELVDTHAFIEINGQYFFTGGNNEADISKFVFNDLLLPSPESISGSWFDPENPGHGIFLEALNGSENQNDRVNMYWFTHHNGQPVWMVGASEIIDNQPLTIDLHIAEGADFPPDFDADNVISNEWGQVTFNFDTPHDIKMSWDSLFSEFGSGSVDLIQLSAISESADGCYSGSFYSLNEPGHGLFIHITDMANEQKQINVAWFAFQDGEQLWLVGSGVFKKDGISTITLTQASGASFFDVNTNQGWSFNSDDIMAAEWGVLRLSFTDQHNMFFNYQPNDLDHFQAGNLEMTRLTEIKGHGCE